MQEMHEFFLELEDDKTLDIGIIRGTKIREVLALITRLEYIPNETTFQFKLRSRILLNYFNKLVRNNRTGLVEAVAEDFFALKSANSATDGKGKRRSEDDVNDKGSRMTPVKKKPKNGVKLYLTIEGRTITDLYQNHTSSENLETHLVVPYNAKQDFVRSCEAVCSKSQLPLDSGSSKNGDRGVKTAQRSKPAAIPKAGKRQTL
jgi:hypothetical protein